MRPPRPRLAQRLTRALLAALLVVAASSATACRHRTPTPDESLSEPLPEFVFVSIENHNGGDIVVTLVRPDGTLLRMGTVTAGRTVMLRFPGEYIASGASLQLIAKPIGGFSMLRSQRFTVQPGQQVVWTIENSLDRSSLAVY